MFASCPVNLYQQTNEISQFFSKNLVVYIKPHTPFADKEPTSGILASENGTPHPTTDSKGPHGTLADPALDGSAKQMILSTTEVNSASATTLNPNISCDLGHMQIAAAIISTFVITAVVAVLLTAVVMCVCVKPKPGVALQKRNSVSSPTDCSERNNIISAVNNSACEEAGIIPN